MPNTGLTKWFKEDWRDVKTGKPCGRKSATKSKRSYPVLGLLLRPSLRLRSLLLNVRPQASESLGVKLSIRGSVMPRNYKQEYDRYHSKPDQRKKRSSRNKARRKLSNAGVSVAGKDVHHKDGNPKNNSHKNLTTTSKTKNRSFARNRRAGKK